MIDSDVRSCANIKLLFQSAAASHQPRLTRTGRKVAYLFRHKQQNIAYIKEKNNKNKGRQPDGQSSSCWLPVA